MKLSEDTTFSLPNIVRYFIIGIIGCLLLTYVLYQARQFISGPSIVMSDLPQPEQHNQLLTLHGTATNIMSLYLNDRPILTNKNGYFEEVLILQNGYTIHSIRTEDRYGRKEVITIPIVYKPEDNLETTNTENHAS